MAEVGSYGHPHCATCGGRGVSFDRERRPRQCVPCSSARREETEREFGYVLECRACMAVLTAEERRAAKAVLPPLWRLHGPLCRFCIRETTERKSA